MASNGYVNLLGKTRIGETLQAKVEDPNGVSGVRYQWFANGKAISGATGSTLLLHAGHVGKQISVQASYTDRAGNRETPLSEYSPAVMDRPAKLPDYKAAAGQPTVSLSGTPVIQEGQKATYTVKLDKAAKQDISVDIEIVHGTTSSLDAATSHDTQRVIIKKGQTAATFTVDTVADGITEGRESYQVRISQAKLGAVYEEKVATSGQVSKQSTILVSYSYPDNGAADPYWAAVHAKGNSKIPMVLINPNSGPGNTADANYVKLVNANTQAGFKNIAYIKTVYGSRSLDEVKADINAYFKLYGKKNIHGFFFDEVGTQSNHQVAYMAEIYNHVKSISPQMVVMANPGWHIPDSIAPYADIFVTGEMSADKYINHYQPATSAFENSATNSKHIMHMVYGADPSQYDKILQLSRERNAGWIFITSDDQTHPTYNPYDDLPKNFNSLIDKSHLGTPDSPVGTSKAPPSAINIGTATVQTDIVETLADNTRPFISVTADKTTLKTGESAKLTFTPSEAVKDFDWNDVRISKGGYLMDFRPTNDGKYTARLVTYDSGKVNLSIAPESFSDMAGNRNSAATPLTFDVKTQNADTVRPTIRITADKTTLKVGESAKLTFTPSESIQNFDWNDVRISKGGYLMNFRPTGDGKYTADLVTYETGKVNLFIGPATFSDKAGNQNEAGTPLIFDVKPKSSARELPVLKETVEMADAVPAVAAREIAPLTVKNTANTAPVLNIQAAHSTLKEGEETKITFTLSEKVKNFERNDIIVTEGGRLTNFAKQNNSDTVYTANFTATKAGTVNLTVRAGSFSDMEHLQNQTDKSISLQVASTRDTTPPVLTISTAKNVIHPGDTTTLTFSLSEPVRNFAANDLIVKGGKLLGGLQKINDTTYTAQFMADKAGTASIQVRAGSFSDITAGNQNRDTNFTFKITPAPEPTISITGDSKVNEGASANYAVKLSHANNERDVIVNVALKSASGNVNTIQQVIIPKGQTSAIISGKLPAGSQLKVREFSDVDDLIKANLKGGDTVRLTGHDKPGDVKILYKISDQKPTDTLLDKISIKLANGKYALPDISDTYLPAKNTATQINEFINIGKTYEAAGTKLIWNDKVHTPISYPNEIIHNSAANKIGGKFGLTCSTFVGMVMSAWKYGDTTYVKNQNTKAHKWGSDFDVATGLPKSHVGAAQLLKYLYSTDRTAFHTPGKTDYQTGDIIFFSNPGKYKESNVFMNAYHVGIYVGDGKIMHSAGTYHSNKGGVVIEKIHPSIIADISLIARPRLTEKDLFQIEIPDDKIARSDTLTLSVHSASGAKTDNKPLQINIIDNDGKARKIAAPTLFSLEGENLPDMEDQHETQTPLNTQNETAADNDYKLHEETLPELPEYKQEIPNIEAFRPTADNHDANAEHSHNLGETPLLLPDSLFPVQTHTSIHLHDTTLPSSPVMDSDNLDIDRLLDTAETPLLLAGYHQEQETSAVIQTPADYAIEPGMSVRIMETEQYAIL